jgi:hypothetical protein
VDRSRKIRASRAGRAARAAQGHIGVEAVHRFELKNERGHIARRMVSAGGIGVMVKLAAGVTVTVTEFEVEAVKFGSPGYLAGDGVGAAAIVLALDVSDRDMAIWLAV